MSAPPQEPGRSPFERPVDGDEPAASPVSEVPSEAPSEAPSGGTERPDPFAPPPLPQSSSPVPAPPVPAPPVPASSTQVPPVPAGYPQPAPSPYARPDSGAVSSSGPVSPFGPVAANPNPYARPDQPMYARPDESGYARPDQPTYQPAFEPAHDPAHDPAFAPAYGPAYERTYGPAYEPAQEHGQTGDPVAAGPLGGPHAGPPFSPPFGSPSAPYPATGPGSGPPRSPGPQWTYDVPASPPTPVAPPRRHRGVAALVTLGICAALLAGVLGGVVGASLQDRLDSRTTRTVDLPRIVSQEGDPDRGAVAKVAAAVLPSVVSLEVRKGNQGNTGSGFVIQKDGFILTNNHVVDAAADGGTIRVLFPDGDRLDAKIVGRDEAYDLAVIKVESKDPLAPLEFADSAQVAVGDEVVAIGAPLGLDSTVTQGIISALDRPVVTGENQATAFINAIQTDAAINPGNSGGPLVDLSGRVVGVNSAIARTPGLTTGGNIGLGFAIPSNQAHRTAQQLIDDGKATHPVIGVLLARNDNRDGAHVSTEKNPNGDEPVSKGGPADRAGIRPGDVVVAFNGRPITSSDELIVAIRAQVPGDTVTLTIRRDGRERDVEVTLDAAK